LRQLSPRAPTPGGHDFQLDFREISQKCWIQAGSTVYSADYGYQGDRNRAAPAAENSQFSEVSASPLSKQFRKTGPLILEHLVQW